MKKLLILFAVLGAWAAQAQSTNAPPARSQEAFQALAAQQAKEAPAGLQELKPNEIASGRVIYNGSAVEAVKTGKPLQLLNPFAPPQYGSPEDNLSRNAINGRVSGLKFFALRF
jgi:hypothetical protein